MSSHVGGGCFWKREDEMYETKRGAAQRQSRHSSRCFGRVGHID
jgi:hypothetical protein